MGDFLSPATWKRRHDSGESYRQIAADVGVSKDTIQRRVQQEPLSQNASYNSENETPAKREVVGYRITEYTQSATAAKKIREKFGDQWAVELAEHIVSMARS